MKKLSNMRLFLAECLLLKGTFSSMIIDLHQRGNGKRGKGIAFIRAISVASAICFTAVAAFDVSVAEMKR
jgi:hypothetical protein